MVHATLNFHVSHPTHNYDSSSIPGIENAIRQNPSILYPSQKSRSFDDGSVTYNNSTIGYNNSTIGYQWGGTNCTAGVTNFERFTDRESDYDSYPNSGHEPDLGCCSVSE